MTVANVASVPHHWPGLGAGAGRGRGVVTGAGRGHGVLEGGAGGRGQGGRRGRGGEELVPGAVRAGGRGGQRGVGELQVLARQSVVIQLQHGAGQHHLTILELEKVCKHLTITEKGLKGPNSAFTFKTLC